MSLIFFGGVRLFVDSTTFLIVVYNLQQKFEQNLHLHLNRQIYKLHFRQNDLKWKSLFEGILSKI